MHRTVGSKALTVVRPLLKLDRTIVCILDIAQRAVKVYVLARPCRKTAVIMCAVYDMDSRSHRSGSLVIRVVKQPMSAC